MDEEKRQRVRGYLDANPEDEKERFLLDYVKNMRWKEEDDDYVPRQAGYLKKGNDYDILEC